jgi:hypothetical protein
MKMPRLSIAWAMVLVAMAALNLAVIRALYDGYEEQILFDSLPTANIMVFAAIAGVRHRRWRACTIGFVVASALSLLAYHVWSNNHPWTWLHYFEPLAAIAQRIKDAYISSHMLIIYGMLIVVFSIPHAIIGLAGGYLAAEGWAIMKRRK